MMYFLELERLVSAEQAEFRTGRSAKDSIGRLVQQVQDGWNIPRSRLKSLPLPRRRQLP